jgi:hypothetical protein
MSAYVIVAIVFAVMFIGGIVVGFITVIAISAVRADHRAELASPDGAAEGACAEQDHCVFGIPGRWDDRPLWPGDSSTDQAAEYP